MHLVHFVDFAVEQLQVFDQYESLFCYKWFTAGEMQQEADEKKSDILDNRLQRAIV